MALVRSRERHLGIRTLERRVAGDERSRVTIDTETEVHEIEHRRRPGVGAKHGRIASCRCTKIRLFDRHRVNLLGAQRHVGEQALVQLREIARGITQRRHSFVDLEDVHAFPRYGHVRQAPSTSPSACRRR